MMEINYYHKPNDSAILFAVAVKKPSWALFFIPAVPLPSDSLLRRAS